jgi:hypothetical protein
MAESRKWKQSVAESRNITDENFNDVKTTGSTCRYSQRVFPGALSWLDESHPRLRDEVAVRHIGTERHLALLTLALRKFFQPHNISIKRPGLLLCIARNSKLNVAESHDSRGC